MGVCEEVAIEIDVVFVRTSNPGHSEWIQNVNENQCGVVRERRQAIEELKLYGGAGKALDSVNAGRMKESVLRRVRSKPADVDAQAVAGRRTSSQFQGMEPTARPLHLATKFSPCFLVVLGKM